MRGRSDSDGWITEHRTLRAAGTRRYSINYRRLAEAFTTAGAAGLGKSKRGRLEF